MIFNPEPELYMELPKSKVDFVHLCGDSVRVYRVYGTAKHLGAEYLVHRMREYTNVDEQSMSRLHRLLNTCISDGATVRFAVDGYGVKVEMKDVFR